MKKGVIRVSMSAAIKLAKKHRPHDHKWIVVNKWGEFGTYRDIPKPTSEGRWFGEAQAG